MSRQPKLPPQPKEQKQDQKNDPKAPIENRGGRGKVKGEHEDDHDNTNKTGSDKGKRPVVEKVVEKSETKPIHKEAAPFNTAAEQKAYLTALENSINEVQTNTKAIIDESTSSYQNIGAQLSNLPKNAKTSIRARSNTPPRRNDTYLHKGAGHVKEKFVQYTPGVALELGEYYVGKIGEGLDYANENYPLASKIAGAPFRAIDYAADGLATGVRRGLRAAGVSQNLAQDIGDTIKYAGDLFIPGAALKSVKYANNLRKTCVVTQNNLLWGSWRQYPKVMVEGKEYAKIGDRLYTRHAVDMMQNSSLGIAAGATELKVGRNFSPNLVEHVIQNGQKTSVLKHGAERTIYTLGESHVVAEGNIIITVNPTRR